jgi:hypothetical protein
MDIAARKYLICGELLGGPDRDRIDDLFHAIPAKPAFLAAFDTNFSGRGLGRGGPAHTILGTTLQGNARQAQLNF